MINFEWRPVILTLIIVGFILGYGACEIVHYIDIRFNITKENNS